MILGNVLVVVILSDVFLRAYLTFKFSVNSSLMGVETIQLLKSLCTVVTFES